MDDKAREVIRLLSELIYDTDRGVATEQAAPRYGADRSEELIEDGLKRSKRLREIRYEFEVLATGVIR